MALTSEELARLNSRLQLYYAAEEAILRNQSYDMPDGRSLTRTNLKDVRDEIRAIRSEIGSESGTIRIRGRARAGVVMSR